MASASRKVIGNPYYARTGSLSDFEFKGSQLWQLSDPLSSWSNWSSSSWSSCYRQTPRRLSTDI